MTFTFFRKAATVALLATAASGAMAATEVYSESFDALTGGNVAYGGANVLAGFSGALFSGSWTEAGNVLVGSDASGTSLRFAANDAMTFSFTLASNAAVASYNVDLGFFLGGNNASSAVSYTTDLGTVTSPATVGNTGLASQTVNPTFSFTGLSAGSYSFTVARSARQVSFDDFSVSATSVAAPVPEPETYAMMLAGLGAVGFMARRRQGKQA